MVKRKNPYEKVLRLLEWLIVNKHNERIRGFPVEEKKLWKLPNVSELLKNRASK